MESIKQLAGAQGGPVALVQAPGIPRGALAPDFWGRQLPLSRAAQVDAVGFSWDSMLAHHNKKLVSVRNRTDNQRLIKTCIPLLIDRFDIHYHWRPDIVAVGFLSAATNGRYTL